jgi:hypothetical protein
MTCCSTASRARRARRFIPSFATRFALCALLVPGSASAASEIVLGDSIGVGVSAAAGLPRLARPSVSLRNDDIFDQLRRSPRGATAYLALGANDAFDAPRSVPPAVDRIIAAAERADLRLVWIGPPCVRRKWNHKAQALDALLRTQLAGRAAYVSMIAPRFCDAAIKAADGVHFTMRGYRLLWAETRAAAKADIAATGSIVPRTHPPRVTEGRATEGRARD